MTPQSLQCLIEAWCAALRDLPMAQQVEVMNEARRAIHAAGPFASEPVDLVQWVPSGEVVSNDHNPNNVAAPEMALLRLSIASDGYTQPIVAWDRDGEVEVVDGFHRNRVGKECEEIRQRIHGYLPITLIKADRADKADRIASTVRHNRARGKHAISRMSDIVVELKRRNWSDEKVGRELGMDADEVLRLSQISGLAEMFGDRGFSEAWDAADPLAPAEVDLLDVEGDRRADGALG